MIFVLDSLEVLMRTALRYEHDRPATTINSRRCEWRDQNSKNFRENWGLPPSCIYRPKWMIYDPQTPWYSYWTHLRYRWGQPCDMSTIDLQQQSIQDDVIEETKTVKISGRIGGYLHHERLPLSCIYRPKSMVDDPQMPWYYMSIFCCAMDFFQTRNQQETILKLNFLDFFLTRKNNYFFLWSPLTWKYKLRAEWMLSSSPFCNMCPKMECQVVVTTIDSRWCEWRDQNSKNSRKNWGLPPSCIYRPILMVDILKR